MMLHHCQQPRQLSSRAQPAVAVVRQHCAALHEKLCCSHIFVDNGVVQCGRSREIFDTQKSGGEERGERRKERREERERELSGEHINHQRQAIQHTSITSFTTQTKKNITTMKFNKRRTHTLVPFIVLSCFSLFVTKIPRRSNTRKHATSTLRSVEPSLLDGLLRAAWRMVLPSESATSGMTPLSRSSSRISMTE